MGCGVVIVQRVMVVGMPKTVSKGPRMWNYTPLIVPFALAVSVV